MQSSLTSVVVLLAWGALWAVGCESDGTAEALRPNIVLVMADDQGWGQTGYNGHPRLQTPNLDAMAAGGLRFDRFYAGGPVCSPTRATVLTGRSHMRCGVNSHGYALRLQERTLAQALQSAGYATGHFGKWHLDGIRGPGVPILPTDSHRPDVFGFAEWLSVTNFFDRDPILSRRGEFIEFQGDSSTIVVDQALKFIRRQSEAGKPFLAVVWYGTPHSPFRAAEQDARQFADLDEASQNHYGELVAMDRSLGTLRDGLRALEIQQNTLIWFCSDNGGLPQIQPSTVAGLRGHKGNLYEGGLRVPAILEWPARITTPRVTQFPAVTMDIFPTIAEIVGLRPDVMQQPIDGISLVGLLEQEIQQRSQPIPFHYAGNSALIDNDFKLMRFARNQEPPQYELYDLTVDPDESDSLVGQRPALTRRLARRLDRWLESMRNSVAGGDYDTGHVEPGNPSPRFWTEIEAYQPYFDSWRRRPEYRRRLSRLDPK